MTHDMGGGNTDGHEDTKGAILRNLALEFTETPAEKIRRERKARFLEVLQEEGHITQAAARLGVAPSTVYRWRVQDPAFNDAIADWLTEDMEVIVATNMFRIATSTDPKLANATVKAGEFMLKSLNRETYGDQIKQESTVTVNHQVQVIHEARDTIRQELRASQQQRLQALRTIDMPSSEGDV